MRWPAALLGLALALPSPAATDPGDDAPITLATPRFNISIAPSSCLATSSYRGPDGTLLTSSPVPFLSFYNRVSDARDQNLEGCVSVARAGSDVLRVKAAHGAGSVDISVSAQPEHLLFTVADLSGWSGADPVEKHLAFGEFWQGMPGMDNATSPPVMGKLQASPSSPPPPCLPPFPDHRHPPFIC